MRYRWNKKRFGEDVHPVRWETLFILKCTTIIRIVLRNNVFLPSGIKCDIIRFLVFRHIIITGSPFQSTLFSTCCLFDILLNRFKHFILVVTHLKWAVKIVQLLAMNYLDVSLNLGITHCTHVGQIRMTKT